MNKYTFSDAVTDIENLKKNIGIMQASIELMKRNVERLEGAIIVEDCDFALTSINCIKIDKKCAEFRLGLTNAIVNRLENYSMNGVSEK